MKPPATSAALTAVGATSATPHQYRRAAGLALLGAVLGAIGAYLALFARYRSQFDMLTRVPCLELFGIVVALPAPAGIGRWVLVRDEPPPVARQALLDRGVAGRAGVHLREAIRKVNARELCDAVTRNA